MTELSTVVKGRPKRRRMSRRSVFFCKVTFVTYTPPGSFSERLRTVEVPLDDPELKQDMDKTFNLWLKGNIEPDMVMGTPNSAAVTVKAAEVTAYLDKQKKRRHKSKEIPLTKAYVSAMKYYDTDQDGYEEDEDGKPIKPWLHIVFHDGSQVDLPLKRKRR